MKLNKYILLAIWVGMYILCAVLGFLPPQEGGNKILLMVIAVLFFLPPALLLYHSQQTKDRKLLQLVQRISLIVLIASVVVLLLNLFSIALLLVMPEDTALVLGDALYDLLILVSTPMVCGQSWGIGLIGWASLLWTCIFLKKAMKN